MTKSTILCIVGPTSSGKTSLALKVADQLPSCAIFSVDSRQVYTDLSILTGKDIPSELPPNVYFHGIDLLEPDNPGNIVSYLKKTTPLVDRYLKKNIPVIFVGGSGLYFKALTGEWTDLGIPPDQKLRRTLETLPLSKLQDYLKNIDESQFNKLNNSDKNNPRRLIRYIEKHNDSPKLSLPTQISAHLIWAGLSLSKQSQIDRITARIESRLDQGVIDEVRLFLAKHPQSSLPIYSSLGLKEIKSYLDGEITPEQMKSDWLRSELDYARRQMVWFNKQPGIIWYDEDMDKNKLSVKLATAWQQK